VSTPSLLRLRRFGNASALADALIADPSLPEQHHLAQQAALDQARGPFSAPIAAELAGNGWRSTDLILGVPSIREAWVRDHGPLPSVRGVSDPDVLLALGEIDRVRPQVILDANLNVLDRVTVPFVRDRFPEVRLLVGYMGTEKRFHRAIHLDVVLVPCHAMAAAIGPVMRGSVHVLPHSFDPDVLTDLPARSVDHPLVFAGALGPRYVERHRLLMGLFETTPIEAWIGLRKGVTRTDDGRLTTVASELAPTLRGRMVGALPLPLLTAAARRSDRFGDHLNAALATRGGGTIHDEEPLEDPAVRFGPRCHAPVAGQGYFELLRRSGAVFHRGIDALGACGGALRLFEVTGAGAALLADDSPMLRELFVDGEEIVLYDGFDDCIAKARWLIDHPEERERIAVSGHARTLRDHTTGVRARRLAELLVDELAATA
jgi:glycosyltransferase involved in cell wall biosynthesis